jgi:hypothetical protein
MKQINFKYAFKRCKYSNDKLSLSLSPSTKNILKNPTQQLSTSKRAVQVYPKTIDKIYGGYLNLTLMRMPY